METYNELISEIDENSKDGYATAILGANGKALVWGSLVSDKCELPDTPGNCSLVIHSGPDCKAMQLLLEDYKVINQ